MPNVSDTTVSQQSARGSNATKRLIQAAALASALIPLGAVAVEGATIQCVTNEADSIGCNGVSGAYPAGSGEQSNIWKFYESAIENENTEEEDDYIFQNLLYSFEITGIPDVDFSLDVTDEQIDRVENGIIIDFPNSTCIPLLEDEDICVIFHVSPVGEDVVDWDGTYYVEIRWFADGPLGSLSKPDTDGRNHIFRSEDGELFNDVLETELYEPELEVDPEDPALGGRGDVFSSFIAGRADVNVPEPATLLLLGTGLAATLFRRRRR